MYWLRDNNTLFMWNLHGYDIWKFGPNENVVYLLGFLGCGSGTVL